jgi:hypothetical protein
MTELSEAERKFLREAAVFFDDPGVFAKSLNWMGRPLETLQNQLPETARSAIARATQIAIQKALVLSIKSIPAEPSYRTFEYARIASQKSGVLHAGLATLTGGLGGSFGLTALPIELPLTTAIILRSIAKVAQEFGHDLHSPEVQMECLYVFSLGSASKNDDEMESAYYSSRVAYAQLLKSASAFVAGSSVKEAVSALEKGAAPLLSRLITKIAAQFEIRVSQKMIAQAAPVIGALGGAGLNLLFTRHFNECAKYHFGIQSLERVHGAAVVQNEFRTSV